MSAYHATHESPYADDCPDCAGYPEPVITHEQSRLVVLLCVLGLAVMVLLAFAAGVRRD